MEENLKTTRLIHNILILLTATIFAFAVSPNKTQDYLAAFDELARLKKLSEEGSGVSCRSGVINIALGKSPLGRNPGNTTPKEIYSQIFKKQGLEISNQFEVIPPFYCDKPPGIRSRLEEFRRYLLGSSYHFYLLNLARDNALLEIAVKRLVANPSTWESLRESKCEKVHFLLPPSAYARSGEIDREDDELKGQPQEPTMEGRIELEFSGADGEPRVEKLYGTFPLVLMAVSHSPNKWLAEMMQNKNAPAKGEWPVPAFTTLSNSVDAMTIDEARAFLQQKLDGLRNEVTIFGMAIDVSVLVWAGPAITLVMLLYLFSHIRTLRRAIEPQDEFKTFLWIALFTDRLSRVLTISSVVALPVLSNYLLLARSFRAREQASQVWNEPSMIAGVIVTLSVCVCGLLVVSQISKLRAALSALDKSDGTL